MLFCVICVFCLFVVLVRLSVTVQVTGWGLSLENDLQCVDVDVKPYSLTHFPAYNGTHCTYLLKDGQVKETWVAGYILR